MIYQICDVMMSINTWNRVHFWIYLLNHGSLCHQTYAIDRYNQEQYFSGIIWTIWVFFYVKIPVFHFFEKVNKRQLQMIIDN